jgi:hypothetical protein
MSDDRKETTYLVTHAGEDSAVLKAVEDGQVHTLSEAPDVEVGDVVRGTLAPEPPMEVTWRPVSIEERRRVTVERTAEPPTRQAREIAADAETGEVTVRERAGNGEIHVLRVPPDRTEGAASDVIEDEATLVRAARMDEVSRVEVRSADGVVSVRYLP